MSLKKPTSSIQRLSHNPMDWPNELLPLFEEAMTCEFVTLTRQGIPITSPVTPYLGDDERSLDISTGLTYPAKAERARRNPRVALLYSDAIGTSLSRAPIILVHGHAVVHDLDIQANTDRYVRLSLAKSPAGFQGTPPFFLRTLAWYFARIWIQVTPLRILWWSEGRTDELPHVWEAPADLPLPGSDPAPPGKQPPPWKEPDQDWQKSVEYAVRHLGLPVLTTVDATGVPTPMRAKQVERTREGLCLVMPAGAPAAQAGPACLTFHTHPQVFSGQENRSFLGHAVPREHDTVDFVVERSLADWSLVGSRLQAGLEFFNNGRRVMPRLRSEAARRSQPVPRIDIPPFW